MRVNWMLADYAMMHQGRLFITGAGIDIITAKPSVDGYIINFGIGLTIIVPWDAMNQEHNMLISITDADGKIVPLGQPPPGSPAAAEDSGKVTGTFLAQRGPSMISGDDGTMPFALQFLGLQVPRLGPYKLRLEIDGTELVSARFRVQDQEGPWPVGLALAEH